MSRLGTFDGWEEIGGAELRDLAWFDTTLVAEGWFSPDLIDAGAVAAADTNLKPWQLQGGMGAIVVQ